MQCPKCKTDRAHRSHRNGLGDYVAGLFSYYPYRCRNCQHRFRHSRHQDDLLPSDHPSTEREIRANRRARDWRRKKRNLTVYGMALVLFLVFLYMVTRNRTDSDPNSSERSAPAERPLS